MTIDEQALIGMVEKKAKQKGKSESISCKYDLGHEGGLLKMTAKCRECVGKHTLEDRACLRAVIAAYSKEFNVDTITLSHFIETQYYDQSIDLLKNMIQFSNELENLSMRDPAEEYFRATTPSAQRKYPCGNCQYNPKTIFSGLRGIFVEDITGFYNQFKSSVVQLQRGPAGKTEHCKRCVKATLEDLDYTFSKFEELTRDVIKKGFSIVLGAEQVR
jgi:hypothetical protein